MYVTCCCFFLFLSIRLGPQEIAIRSGAAVGQHFVEHFRAVFGQDGKNDPNTASAKKVAIRLSRHFNPVFVSLCKRMFGSVWG